MNMPSARQVLGSIAGTFGRARQMLAGAVVAGAMAIGNVAPGLRWFKTGQTNIAGEIRSILGAFNPRAVGLKERLLMRDDPDVAFGLAILRSPIVNLEWSMVSEDEEAAAFAESNLRPLYRQLAIAGSMAMHFGNQVVAKEWEVVENFTVKQTTDAEKGKDKVYPFALVYRRFKAIDPRTVKILIDPALDDWAGIEQDLGNGFKTRVGREGALLWAFRRQEVWGALRGYPVSDQAYDPWYTKNAIRFCRNRYMERRADPAWMGRASAIVTRGGRDEDGYAYMAEQLAALKGGGQMVFPNVRDDRGNYMFDASLITDDKRGDMFQQAIDAEGVQILRSMWITDKAGTSDGSGSLAMAEVHAETMALGLQAVLFEWIEEVINAQVVQPLIEMNFGPERARKAQVRMVGKGISPAMKALFKDLILNLISAEQLQPDGKHASLVQRMDGPALCEQLGVPLRSEDEVQSDKPGKTDEEAATDDLTKPGDPVPTTDEVPTGNQEVKVSETSVLNGAQITAAVDIVKAVVAGEMPKDSGLGALQVLFNLTPAQAKQIMGSAEEGEKEQGPGPSSAVPPGTAVPSPVAKGTAPQGAASGGPKPADSRA